MPPLRLIFYAASAAGVYMLGHAWFLAPPPFSWAIAAWFAYVGLVIVGICFSNGSMFIDVITRGPRDGHGIALTFDDGPDPNTTPEILKCLRQHGIKASFFVIGKKAEANPELIRHILRDGHTLGLHSYEHDRLFALRSAQRVRDDLDRAAEVIEAICGQRPRLFRAPIGHISPAMARVIQEQKLLPVGWSLRGYDGLPSATADKVVQRIGSRLNDGEIVLLHDAAERGDFRPASLAALPKLLTAATRKNLRFVPLATWLGEEHRLHPKAVAPSRAEAESPSAQAQECTQGPTSQAKDDGSPLVNSTAPTTHGAVDKEARNGAPEATTPEGQKPEPTNG